MRMLQGMAQICNVLAFTLLWTFVFANMHIERSGVLTVNQEDIAIQFFIMIANDLQTRLVVTPKKPRCCWEVERGDIDCKSMELVGWNEIEVLPSKTRNITYIFPNIYPLDRVGKCHFLLRAEGRQLSHSIAFNTTEERKTSWRDILGFGDSGSYMQCSTVDLNPRNKCKPVSCVQKYNGHRSFFNKERRRCEKVHECYTKTRNDELPEIAYDKDFNTCKSLIGDKLTPEQENWMKQQSDQSEIAKERYKLEKADDINPSPLNCHHGHRIGSVCVCNKGWKTDITKAKFKDKKFIVHWCNEEIKVDEQFGYKVQRSLLLSGLSIIATALLIGWLSVIWFFYFRKEDNLAGKIKSLVANIVSRSEAPDDSLRKGMYGVVRVATILNTGDGEIPLTEGNRLTDIAVTGLEDWWEGSYDEKRGIFHQGHVEFHLSDGSIADISAIIKDD